MLELDFSWEYRSLISCHSSCIRRGPDRDLSFWVFTHRRLANRKPTLTNPSKGLYYHPPQKVIPQRFKELIRTIFGLLRPE